MDQDEYLKWIVPSMKNRTVSVQDLDGRFNFRIEKAKEQNLLSVVDRQIIIKHVNDFLSSLGMKKASEPRVKPKKSEKRRIAYSKINLENKEDIVWIKFSDNEHISVIGTSCDIFFTEYAKENTTAGLINRALGLKWDENEVLVFPLYDLKEGLTRSDIESGIGNYLISKGVPILDFYSHNY